MSIVVTSKNGRKVHSSKFTVNEELKTFYSEVEGLSIKSSEKEGLYGWTIFVKGFSTVEVMHGCTVHATNDCTIIAGSDNQITCLENCNIKCINRNTIKCISYNTIQGNDFTIIEGKHHNKIEVGDSATIQTTIYNNIKTGRFSHIYSLGDDHIFAGEKSSILASDDSFIRAQKNCRIKITCGKACVISENNYVFKQNKEMKLLEAGIYKTFEEEIEEDTFNKIDSITYSEYYEMFKEMTP